MLDKLELRFRQPVALSLVKKWARRISLPTRHTTLRDRKTYLVVGHRPHAVHFRAYYSRDDTQHLITNPSAFGTFKHYVDYLSALVPESLLHTAQIKRLDIALDFLLPIEALLRCVHVAHKSSSVVHRSGSRITGVYFGKGNDKIVAYDKSQQLRLTDQTRCRIEQQMTGKKVPTKHLLDLPAALCVGSFRALADVSMADIRLVDLGSIERKSDVHRHGELQSLLSIIGLQETKKILNKHGRFQRDYQKLLIEKPMAKPSELAFASLAKFFDLP